MIDHRDILLVYPPFGDYTYPYHSLAYVAPPLTAAGYRAEILDLNALWFRSLFTTATVCGWRGELQGRLDQLEALPEWTIETQENALEILECLAICDELEPEAAVETLRSERFYDYDLYLHARQQVRSFERLLSYLYRPYDFFAAFAHPVYVGNSGRLIQEAQASRRLIDDLAALLRTHSRAGSYLFCGVSAAFGMNLLPAMATLLAARRVFPNARLIAGGTAISDLYKYKESLAALEPLRAACDHLYIGEAELGVAAYASWCSGVGQTLPSQVVDLAEFDPRSEIQSRSLAYVTLSDGPAAARFEPYDWRSNPPDYSWIDWNLYLSPVPQVNYSPSRGCFWNKCTFCDYGLNDDAPTAPSRTMDVETVVEHLGALAAQGVRHVYFAVDAIAPKFLNQLAEAVIRKGLRLSWSAELFLTRNFTPEMVNALEQSGMITASFGLESGSSRVLERMGKGKNRREEVLEPVFESFRGSPIGLQPKFFFGFPGETDEDRHATVDLLLEHHDILSVVTKGNVFDLTLGSQVARNPGEHGIRNLRRRPDENVGGCLLYDLQDGGTPCSSSAFAPFNDKLEELSTFERPWAGGIDTLHTKLYLERFGRDVFHRLRERYAENDTHIQPWHSVSGMSHYDLDAVFQNVLVHQAAQICDARARMEAELAEDFETMLEWARSPLSREMKAESYHLSLRWDERSRPLQMDLLR